MQIETKNDLQTAMTFCKSKTVIFSKKRDTRKLGRGNPFLSRKRFKTIEEIDSRIENLLKNNENL